MAETVTKTVEDVDKLFSQIVVNGETFNSDRYVPPAPVLVTEEPETEPAVNEPESQVPSETVIQGEDVHAVDLNGELHNFVDPEEVSNREEADSTLQGNIDDITELIPSDTSPSNKLVNEDGVSDVVESVVGEIVDEAVDTAVADAVAELDVPAVGGGGKYIYEISETNGKITAKADYIASSLSEVDSDPISCSAVTLALKEAKQTVTEDLEGKIADAVNALDVAQSGGSGKYISAISETDGKISATEGTIDSAVTSGSSNLVTSGAVETAIDSAVSGVEQEITDAVNALDVAQSGGSGKYISAISETDGKISATEGTIDSAVTSGSSNLVTSGAVETAIGSAVNVVQASVDDIQALIPNQATAQNQLADKDFVNSSIASNTANFLGTYTSLADIQAIQNPTNNDYAFLQTTDSAGNTEYQRYKYSTSDNQWHYEYTLNNSSFTAEQWATINSGLTEESVNTAISEAVADEATARNTAITNAVNALDVAQSGGSGKYISAISETDGKISATEGTIDSAVTSGSSNPVTGGAVSSALSNKVDKVTGKELSTNDFTDSLKTKLEGIEAGAQVNTVTGVKGNSETNYRTGNINITKANIGLGNVANTGDSDVPASGGTDKFTTGGAYVELNKKVDKTTTVNGHALSSDVTLDKADVGLGNVGNFKAVSTVASQGLTDTEKANARANIGAGTSSFSGSYNDLADKPTLGTASSKDSTDTVTQGSTDLVESGAVADAIQNVTDVASSLPTDAVLHYSFDEVPDYPDGTADVKLFSNTYDIQATDYQFKVNGASITITNNNGNVEFSGTISAGTYDGVYIRNQYINNKIIKIKMTITALSGTVSVLNGADRNNLIATYDKVGTYTFAMQNTNDLTGTKNMYIIIDKDSSATVIIEQIYIGDGSYTTPIIDNANGQNNAVNNGGIAIQGVSGKGIVLLNGKSICNSNFNLTPNFTISAWFNPDNITTNLNGLLLFKQNQIILRNGGSGNNNLLLTLYDINNNAIINQDRVNSLLPANEWTHIVIVRKGATCNVYINGKVTYTKSLANNTISNNLNDFILGGNTLERITNIDDFQIFNRALSDKEVLALYQNKANTPKYYDLNDYRIENADTAPAENSTDLITSGAVYEAMQSSGSVKSVCSQSPDANGDVALTKADIGLGNVQNTGDSAVPASGGTDKFTTGGAFGFFAKSKSASSWLGKVFGRFMGRKWVQVTGYTALAYASKPVYANGLWEAGSSVESADSGIWWSEDGMNWTKGTGQMGSLPYTPAYANGLWLAGQAIGTGGLFKSSDGKTWEKITTLPARVYFDTPVYVNGLWFAVGDMPYWSEDGEVWTQVTGDSARSFMNAPSYANGLWLAGSSSHGLFKSTDGKNWTQVTGDTAGYSMLTPVYANGLWVAGSIEHGLWWSADGVTWAQVTVNTNKDSLTPIYANGLFVTAISNLGLWWSEDGKTWTQVTGNTANKHMERPIYANGLWVAGSDNHGLWWSEDGKTWLQAVTDFASSLTVETPSYGNGMWLTRFSQSTVGSGFCYSDIEMVLETFTD